MAESAPVRWRRVFMVERKVSVGTLALKRSSHGTEKKCVECVMENESYLEGEAMSSLYRRSVENNPPSSFAACD